MKPVVFFLVLGICGLGLISLASAQTPVPGAETPEAPVPTALPSGAQSIPSPSVSATPTRYQFQSDTVWAHLNISVENQDGQFKAKIESSAPMTGWILKKEDDGRILSKGGTRPVQSLEFDVPGSFQENCLLTVLINADGEEVPAAVRLSAGSSRDSTASQSADGEEFQEDPDRPFNKMVKTLYDRAAEDRALGQNEDALTLLKKAQELDPLQPQVQALLEKVRSSMINAPSSPPLNQTSVETDVDNDLKPDSDVRVGSKGKKEKSFTDHSLGSSGQRKSEFDKSVAEDLGPQTGLTYKHKKKSKKPRSTRSADIRAEADQAYNLGLESYRQGDYDDAKKFWEQTLDIDPNHVQAKRNLTRLETEHPDLP